MSKNTSKLTASIVSFLAECPGQHAWAIANAVGISSRLFERNVGERNKGDDVIRSALKSAERAGLVVSVKDGAKRLWFLASTSVSSNAQAA